MVICLGCDLNAALSPGGLLSAGTHVGGKAHMLLINEGKSLGGRTNARAHIDREGGSLSRCSSWQNESDISTISVKHICGCLH